MTIQEAIRARHSVRKYTGQPIEAAKVEVLRSELDKANAESGLNIQLVLEEPKSFSSGIWKYGQFSGVKNYFVMAGPKGKDAEEKIGYYGEEMVILAQMLGLNTCWVGLTYKKIPGTYELRGADVVHLPSIDKAQVSPLETETGKSRLTLQLALHHAQQLHPLVAVGHVAVRAALGQALLPQIQGEGGVDIKELVHRSSPQK